MKQKRKETDIASYVVIADRETREEDEVSVVLDTTRTVAESTSASAERAATREIFILRERRNVVLTGDALVEIVVEVCDLQSSLRVCSEAWKAASPSILQSQSVILSYLREDRMARNKMGSDDDLAII